MLTPLRSLVLLSLGACPLPGGDKSDDTAGEPDGPCLGGASESVLLEDGSPSGYERCEDGTIHRVAVETYDPTIPTDACAGDEEARSCETDADCTALPYGKCVTGTTWDEEYRTITACSCAYACTTDADCEGDAACVPPGVVETGFDYPVCRSARCETDADCASEECGLTSYFDGCGWDVDLSCRTDADACRVDADCEAGASCAGGEAYGCEEESCAIGRLLLVGEGARVAPAVARGDWAAPVRPAATDDALATHWAAAGALEHASVASFARTTLQLLALGAPPDLVLDTQRAAADEVRHARLAYGLATAYGGRPVGPGPLALADAAPALDAAGTMRALVDEACVGEVCGAAEALVAAEACDDPAVAAILREIAADEARHAALAWRTLRWLLEAHPELRAEAEARLRTAMGAPGRAEVHAAALAEVVGPAIEALFRRAAA
ncbi:MAG: ferritin-like domain-containing protein [Myxococcota bacterium]